MDAVDGRECARARDVRAARNGRGSVRHARSGATTDLDGTSLFLSLFLLSLSLSLLSDTLKTYFGAFGSVVNCVVMRHPSTHRSR